MMEMEIENNIADKIKQLEDKYAQMGQDLNSYLEGLLLSNYLTYWDYTQVETLLTLQNPRTDYPDEMIFIMYHQITELYFKLALHELETSNLEKPLCKQWERPVRWKVLITENVALVSAIRFLVWDRLFSRSDSNYFVFPDGLPRVDLLHGMVNAAADSQLIPATRGPGTSFMPGRVGWPLQIANRPNSTCTNSGRWWGEVFGSCLPKRVRRCPLVCPN